MAHFAKLNENNIVLEINVVNNEVLDADNEEASGIDFLTQWSNGYTNWKQTSYNNSFRKQYAGIGYKYDVVNDVFIRPQPYPSWTLDNNFDWQAPIEKPEGNWYWDEEIGNWVETAAL
jgi:murein L,D-transpeptidase YafK